jgi:hypothetical protein
MFAVVAEVNNNVMVPSDGLIDVENTAVALEE